jgi:hypothetical protein
VRDISSARGTPNKALTTVGRVHITVWTSILCAGLPTLGCFVWAYELGAFPKRKAERPQSGASQPSPVSRSLSSRQRFATLAFAVVIGLSCETAMVGLSTANQ